MVRVRTSRQCVAQSIYITTKHCAHCVTVFPFLYVMKHCALVTLIVLGRAERPRLRHARAVPGHEREPRRQGPLRRAAPRQLRLQVRRGVRVVLDESVRLAVFWVDETQSTNRLTQPERFPALRRRSNLRE